MYFFLVFTEKCKYVYFHCILRMNTRTSQKKVIPVSQFVFKLSNCARLPQFIELYFFLKITICQIPIMNPRPDTGIVPGIDLIFSYESKTRYRYRFWALTCDAKLFSKFFLSVFVFLEHCFRKVIAEERDLFWQLFFSFSKMWSGRHSFK